MTAKERKTLEPIVEQTRCKLSAVGYKGALIVGKDIAELRECIKNTWIGLLADADIEDVKKSLEWLNDLQFKREKTKHQNPTQLFLFT